MTFTLSIGWWIAPLIVTCLAFGWARYNDDGYNGYGADVAGMVIYGIAVIASLIAWLVYALLT